MRLLILVLGLAISNGMLWAKIGDPAPIEHNGVRYASHANEVTATDIKTNKELWKSQVYQTIQPESLDPKLEADVQWNIIVSLKVTGTSLQVRDKQGNVYFLDLKTGKKL